MKYIPKGATRLVGSAILYGQKNAPHILFGAGIVGVVATTVMASKATLQLDEVLDEAQTDLERVKTAQVDGYTESARKRDLTRVYTRNALQVGKLYAPTIIVGSLSIAALTRSHQILTSRNTALTAAYNGLLTAFNQYRKRVVDDVGEQKDREYMYGSEERTIVEDTDKGPKKSQIKTYAGTGASVYAKIFDRHNKNYNLTPEYNLQFLRGVQNYLNNRLEARGHVFLNDAYDELGFDRTSEGSQVGWLRSKDGGVDGYIDFGIFEDEKMLQVHEFLSGREGALLVDFNVDGVIWDKINTVNLRKGGQ